MPGCPANAPLHRGHDALWPDLGRVAESVTDTSAYLHPSYPIQKATSAAAPANGAQTRLDSTIPAIRMVVAFEAAKRTTQSPRGWPSTILATASVAGPRRLAWRRRRG